VTEGARKEADGHLGSKGARGTPELSDVSLDADVGAPGQTMSCSREKIEVFCRKEPSSEFARFESGGGVADTPKLRPRLGSVASVDILRRFSKIGGAGRVEISDSLPESVTED
jgi:hypothetical protein